MSKVLHSVWCIVSAIHVFLNLKNAHKMCSIIVFLLTVLIFITASIHPIDPL